MKLTETQGRKLITRAQEGDKIELKNGKIVILKRKNADYKRDKDEIRNGKKYRKIRRFHEVDSGELLETEEFDGGMIFIGPIKMKYMDVRYRTHLSECKRLMISNEDFTMRNPNGWQKDGFLIIGELYHEEFKAVRWNKVMNIHTGAVYTLTKEQIKMFEDINVMNGWHKTCEEEVWRECETGEISNHGKVRNVRVIRKASGKYMINQRTVERVLYETFIRKLTSSDHVGLINKSEGFRADNVYVKGEGVDMVYGGWSVVLRGKFIGSWKNRETADLFYKLFKTHTWYKKMHGCKTERKIDEIFTDTEIRQNY